MEDLLPPLTEHGAGHEPPRVRQFTIFLESKVGRLQNLVRSLEEGVGRIIALSIEESGDAALVRLICAHSAFGRELLRTSGVAFAESELLAVELPKRTRQPLVAICSALLAAEINIHYAYPLLNYKGHPAMALYVDDPTLAAQLLIRKGFTLLAESDLNDSGE
ncbi:MAG TPA: hypothetical protein VFE58_11915 [Tepidisphaeraceae bacterium]|jgi:hypothetical protein|nr:hypothetical protein [Tepidisphaeraceae bacterium]